ncbi:hypothetical protein C1H46_019969 [Malus baccata]|uniref:Uncharacterized protein n=1 Tax=Malus baccata TaxID=106549 RepID=A0A540M6W0_MALBA|nr:hypothetical protein C1H46_019969 [Malus baccata]
MEEIMFLMLKHLSQLTALNIHVPDANLLPNNMFSDKLKSYTIHVGDCWLYLSKFGVTISL